MYGRAAARARGTRPERHRPLPPRRTRLSPATGATVVGPSGLPSPRQLRAALSHTVSVFRYEPSKEISVTSLDVTTMPAEGGADGRRRPDDSDEGARASSPSAARVGSFLDGKVGNSRGGMPPHLRVGKVRATVRTPGGKHEVWFDHRVAPPMVASNPEPPPPVPTAPELGFAPPVLDSPESRGVEQLAPVPILPRHETSQQAAEHPRPESGSTPVPGVGDATPPSGPPVTRPTPPAGADYPTKPVQLMVAYPAGGSTDGAARIVGRSPRRS